MKFQFVFAMLFLESACVLLKSKIEQQPERNLEGFDYKMYQQYDQQLADHLIGNDFQEEVSDTMKKVNDSIGQLNDQKYAMNKILDKTVDRKLNYVKYEFNKASYFIDSTLKFLLDKIAEIDGGQNADAYLKDNKFYTGINN